MRLFHYKLIPYLSDKLLKQQWGDLNALFSHPEYKHWAINYVWDYDKDLLWHYAVAVKNEMVARGFGPVSYRAFDQFFDDCIHSEEIRHYDEHNIYYLQICYDILREHYIRCDGCFTEDAWVKLENFVWSEKKKENQSWECSPIGKE